MKKQTILLAAAGLGGAAGFALRLWQNLTGFEPDTGLPVPGNPAGLLLIALLTAMALVLFALTRKLPQDTENPPSFPSDFSTEEAGLLLLPVAGVFLTALSGAVDLLLGLGILGTTAVELPGFGTVFLFVSDPLSPAFHLVLGVFSLAAAAALMSAVMACRRSGKHEAPASGTFLLVPVVNMVVHLVLIYRADTLNPATQAYYIELLTLTFLVLGFSRLSSFAFGAGRPRTFALVVTLALVLTMTVLSDDMALSSTLLYLGSAAVLLGFLLLLAAKPVSPAQDPLENS